MKKKLEEKIVYEPNETVKVTVSNKPELNDEVTRYKRKVSIVVDLGYDKDKLSFSSDDEIAKFLENIDVEDPQQSLL
ncbi:hypothetical protein EKK58_09355 [Candidatus Dependentiae bacterium]|nr:MAG: hypothetical protein EKK58_09355 [Candidatus Dependentiae bacterium]